MADKPRNARRKQTIFFLVLFIPGFIGLIQLARISLKVTALLFLFVGCYGLLTYWMRRKCSR